MTADLVAEVVNLDEAARAALREEFSMPLDDLLSAQKDWAEAMKAPDTSDFTRDLFAAKVAGLRREVDVWLDKVIPRD